MSLCMAFIFGMPYLVTVLCSGICAARDVVVRGAPCVPPGKYGLRSCSTCVFVYF